MLQTVIGTQKAGRGRSGVTDPAHTHAHSEAGRRETSKRGRVKKRQRTAVTKPS